MVTPVTGIDNSCCKVCNMRCASWLNDSRFVTNNRCIAIVASCNIYNFLWDIDKLSIVGLDL